MMAAISGHRSQLLLAVLLLAMPCVAIITLTNPLLQAGMLDAYIYTGLLHDYTQILRRYGSTYYANRVAFTVPARAAIALFGDAGGHFVLQTTYLLGATLSGFVLGRRYFSTAVGIAAAAWVAFNPWLIRTLTWDYVEGPAVCALLVAFCCFSLNARRPMLLHAAGGVAFAMACNIYPFVAAMALAFAPAWLILNLSDGVRHYVGYAAAALAGFVVGYAGLMLVEYLEMPELGFWRELVTLRVGVDLLAGGGAVWYTPFSEVIARQHVYVLMPAFLAAGLAILIVAEHRAGRRADRFTVAALSCLILTCATYILFHDYFRTAFLTNFTLNGYAFPAGLFAIVGLLGSSARTLPMRAGTLLCAAAALCFALLWFSYETWHVVLRHMTVRDFAVLGGGLTILMAAAKLPLVRAVSALAGAALAIVVFYFPPDQAPMLEVTPANLPSVSNFRNQYAALHDPSFRVADHEIYQAAEFLQRSIAQTLPVSEGPVGFWYGTQPADSPFDSVQSVFLWGYSRIVSSSLPREPGAHLDAELREKLARYPHIAILSRTQVEADAALRALGGDGAIAHLRAQFTFPGKWFGFVITIVDYVSPSAPVGEQVALIPTHALAVQANASRVDTGNGIDLLTAPQQWAYSAIAPLPSGRLLPEKLVLRLRLRVVRGEVGLMIVDPGDLSTSLVPELIVGPTSEPRDADLAFPVGEAARLLIIRNCTPIGPSLVQVSRIALFRAPP